MSNEDKQADWVSAGFERLDDKAVVSLPPQIKWGKTFEAFSDEQKITYLTKLARTMNHAAALIQAERDHLGELCEKKEQQIMVMKAQNEKASQTLAIEIAKMNEQRQQYFKNISELNAKVAELTKAIGSRGVIA